MTYRLLAVMAVLCIPACNRDTDADEDEPSLPQRVDASGRVVLSPAERDTLGLATVAAANGSLTTTVLRFGKVVARPAEDVIITAPVTARIAAVNTTLGASVSRGDRLVAIEPVVDTASRANIETQRRTLQGQIKGARAQLRALHTELERVTALSKSGLATDADRAKAAASVTAEQARLASLRRATGALSQLAGGRNVLAAPAAGVVASLITHAGALVHQGAVVARILRAGPRWIDVSVPPGDPVGSGYRVGTTAGKLLARGATVGPDGSRSDRLELSAAAPASLLPGQTVAVNVDRLSHGVVIPAAAIIRYRGRQLVFVRVKPGTYAPRVVTVVATSHDRAVVSSGVSAGDHVVDRGAAELLGELGRATPTQLRRDR